MSISKQTMRAILFCSFGFALVFSCKGQQTGEDFYKLGLEKYHQSDWDGAITNFTKAIESSYKPFESYNDRAYAKAMKKDSVGAMIDCNKAMELEPNYAGSYYWRSRVELELTNYDDALSDFKIGIKLDPRSRPGDISEILSMQCCRDVFQQIHFLIWFVAR